MLWFREIDHCSTRLEACGLIEANQEDAGALWDGHLHNMERAQARQGKCQYLILY